MSANADIINNVATTAKIDRWAIFLSGLCMVHCLATPFILALVPFFQVASNELLFHAGLLLPLTGFAFWAFWRGYKLHRKKFSIIIGTIGFAFLLLGLGLHEFMVHFGGTDTLGSAAGHAHHHGHSHAHAAHVHAGFQLSWGTIATVVGSLFLVWAHIYNMKFCDCACHDHQD